MKKAIACILLICTLSMALTGCAASKFIGTWEAYKVSTDESEILFSEYASFVKMELTAEFKSDGKYVLDYYVNGRQGDEYPQTGKYKMDGDKIILEGADGYGVIENGELVLYFSDGAVKQYFKPSK